MSTVYLNGVNINKYVVEGSLNIDDAIGERSTCQFVVRCPAGVLNVVVGAKVEVYTNDIKIFGGTIDNIDKVELQGSNPPYLEYSVQCADWHQICDRRIVSEAYENMPAGDIVQSIIQKYLAGEGIVADLVQDGPVIQQAVFNYVPVTQCFDKLADLAGFMWWIDSDKRLYFCDRALYQAPFSIDERSKIIKPKLSCNRDNYRNRQYIRAGKGTTDPQVETFKGNGVQKTFTVGFPIAKVPVIYVNGQQQTVGIKGVDTGKDWYWNKGDAVITQDEEATPLTESDTLQVTYQGFYDIIVLTDDYSAVLERQSVEGGTGLYEAVNEEPYAETSKAAFQSANALLKKYAKLGEVLSFDTLMPGLRAGQLLQVNLPILGAVGEFLIRKVQYRDIMGDKYDYLFSVEAVSCFAAETWTKFFKANLGQPKTYVIRENIQEQEVLIRLVQQSEQAAWAEEVMQMVFACPIPSDELYPSDTLYPC